MFDVLFVLIMRLYCPYQQYVIVNNVQLGIYHFDFWKLNLILNVDYKMQYTADYDI